MSSNRIIYSQATQTGAMVAQAVNSWREAQSRMTRLKEILDRASSGDDWASVAAEVGGGITLQQAQDLWAILSSAKTALDAAALLECARLDQG